MRSILYLGYFLLNTDYNDLAASLRCTVRKGYSRTRLIADMFYCSIRFRSSFVDYFNFQFYRKTFTEREAYASMGYMYDFHRQVNDPQAVALVDNKQKFAERFAQFCNRSRTFSSDEFEGLKAFFCEHLGGKVVLKDPGSTAGRSVQIIDVGGTQADLMLDGLAFEEFFRITLADRSPIFLEDFINQHAALAAISPSGVNTIRVITMLELSGKVRVIGTIFRISVNSVLDNFSAGNLAAEVNPQSGIVETGGIRKRSSCDRYHNNHPVTGASIKGFQIPFWPEIIACATNAAAVVPSVRSVGWDIAVTNTGPIIIEGNSKWAKDTWQIPAGYGKKHLIEHYVTS